jgi:hypothetical protein
MRPPFLDDLCVTTGASTPGRSGDIRVSAMSDFHGQRERDRHTAPPPGTLKNPDFRAKTTRIWFQP